MRNGGVLLLSIVLGCGGPASELDSGIAVDAAGTDGGAADDAGARDRDAGRLDGGPTDGGSCVPTGGGAVLEGYCQQVMLSVLRFDDASPSLYLNGITTSVGDGCTRVDRVELRTTDGELVQMLEGVPGATHVFSARASTVAPQIAALCDGEVGRFDPFAVEVHGATDGGTFVARCGAEAGSSGWPPDLVVSCHSNLPVGPTYMGSGTVQVSAMFTNAEVYFTYPNEAGIVIDDVAGDARVIPGTWGFGSTPIEPFDTTGWTALVGWPTSARTHVSVQMYQTADPFGSELCPVPSDMPMPEDPVPPVFLLGVRGTAGGRPFTSEAMISYCTRTAP